MLERLKSFFRGAADTRIPWRIFWVGLAVRIAYLTFAHTYRMHGIEDHFQFGWEMGRIARALVTGYGYADPFTGHSGPTAWTPPLYPLLLAGVFRVFGVYTPVSAWVILAINSVFSAATALAIYELAWRCFGRAREGMRIALWSAWLWALYPAAMQYAVRWVWDMALTAWLFTWVLVLALRLRGVGAEQSAARQRGREWALFGALWGLIALSNSSLLTFLPACGVWILWRDVRVPRMRWAAVRHALLGAVCCVAIVSPWVVRNWYAFHAFVPMRANFGAELFESVQMQNQGFPTMATLPRAVADPQFQRYRRLGEIAYSREQGRHAVAVIQRYPGLFWKHVLVRFDFFWVSVPHGDDGKPISEFFRVLNYAFVSLSGLLGLALALRRRSPGAWLFFWAAALYPVIYYFVTVQARFRHPLEPVFTVMIVYLFRSADSKRGAGARP